MIQRNTENATLYAISFCTINVAALFTMCSSAFKIKAACLRLSSAFVLTIGALCILSASIDYIKLNCNKNLICAMGHFSFDLSYSGIAFVIAFDALSPLTTKRGRICCYSLVLFISAVLQSFYIYEHRNRDWTPEIKAYQITMVAMAMMSGLLFLSVGIVDLWICVNIKVYCMHCNVFTCMYSLVSFAMVVTGVYVVRSDKDLDISTQGFFVSHLLLIWAISFRICADTTVDNAHLNDDFEHIAGFTNESRSIQIEEREMLQPKTKLKRDFRQNDDWYDTDTDSAFYLTSDSDLDSGDWHS